MFNKVKTTFINLTLIAGVLSLSVNVKSQSFNGVENNLSNLYRLSDAKTRSISPENPTGAKGMGGMSTDFENTPARELGQGWKVKPSVRIKANSTYEVANINTSGAIQQIWLTPTGNWRTSIIRFYWDNEKEPSVEAPLADFFAVGWGKFHQISSIPVCVNTASAMNCYWIMPFKKSCRITVENVDNRDMTLFYQVNYVEADIPDDAAYFHAQFRRTNPVKAKEVYTIVDGIKGKGQYVGTTMSWASRTDGWWGEGEIKFYMDGDKEFPTICGTGTEDYFNGSYAFAMKNEEGKDEYVNYTTPYAGFYAFQDRNIWQATVKFDMYRWHITDPVRFEKDLKITMQSLSWKNGGRFIATDDDIASVAFWYQTEPHAQFPTFPTKDELDILNR